VYGIGAEVSVDYLSVIVLDLRGEIRIHRRVGYDVPRAVPGRTLDALAGMVRDAVAEPAAGRPG
jgi:hypothetical protein